MSNNLERLKNDLRRLAKRCKNIKYTEGLLLAFLMTGLLTFSQMGATSPEIKEARQSIDTSISDMKKLFKEAKQENKKLLKQSNLELIQLMEQGDHVIKSPWSSWQFGMNYFYDSWQGTYKGRGDKEENRIYERGSGGLSRAVRTADGSASKYGSSSINNLNEPISAVPIDASVTPKSVTITTVDGASAPVITTPTLNISVSSVTPSSATVPSITPPTVTIPGVSMKDVSGFTLVFPSSGYFSAQHPTNVNASYTLTSSDARSSAGSGGNNDYISYHNFTHIGSGGITSPTNITATMIGRGVANNIRDNTSFYGGGSRYVFVDDVRNYTNGASQTPTSQVKFILRNEAIIELNGPAITGILNEETSWTEGKTTTNVTNMGSINDEKENITGSYTGTLRGNAAGTIPSYSKTIQANSKNKIGYKVGMTQTVEETIDWTSGTNYEFYNGDGATTFVGFDTFDSMLSAGITASSNLSSLGTTEMKTKLDGTTNDFTQAGVIHFNGDYSTGIQVASENRPQTSGVWPTGTPSTWSEANSRSLVRAINKSNGYIQLDGSHSYGMKLAGTALHIDTNNRDYNDSASDGSYVANEGLILISGSYDTAINGSNAKGSSAGIAKLAEAKWSSKKILFNNGRIYIGGNNNSGILLESIYDDTVTNMQNGIITIDKAYNLFNNPDTLVNYSNAVATSNAGIRVQSFAGTTAVGNLEGVNKGTINLNNGSGNVGIYAYDVNDTSSTALNRKTILGNNTGTGIINVNGTNVGMMAQDASGTSATNFKTIIANSGKINVGGTNSIGMYTKDQYSFAEQISGTIDVSANNVGVVNNGTFDFKGGTISASGINSVGVYSANGANSTTNIGTGTASSATLNVSNGGVGLYADAGSKQTLKGLNATVAGTSTAGSILFYNIPTSGTKGTFDVSDPNAGSATIGAYSFAFYTNENIFSSSTAFAIFLNDWTNSGSGTGINLTMDSRSSLLLADVSNAASKNVAFTNITPVTGLTLQNANTETVAILSGDYQYLTVRGADVSIDETAGYDLSVADNKINKVSIYDSNITVESGINIHDGTTPNVSASANLVNQGYILGVNNGKTLTNKGTITLNSTTPALRTLVAIGTDGSGSSSKAINEGTVTNKTNGGFGIYAGDDAVGTNESAGIITMDGTQAFGIVGSEANTENKGTITINGASSTGMYSYETSASPLHKTATNSGTITTTGDNNIAMVGNYSKILNDTTGIINLNNSNNNVGMYTSAGTSGIITNDGTITGIDGTIGIYGTHKVVLGNSSSTTVGDSGVAVYSSTGDVTINQGAKVQLIKGGTGTTPADNATGLFIENSSGAASIVNINVHNLVQGGLGKKSYGYFFKGVNTLTYTNTNGSSPITLDDDSIFVYSDATAGSLANAQDLTSIGNGVIGVYQKGGSITNAGTLDFITGTKNTALYTENGTATNQAAGTINVGTSNFGMVTTGGSLVNDGNINITANKGTGMYSSSSNAITNNAFITTAAGVTDTVAVYSKSATNTASGKITVGDKNIAIYTVGGTVTNSGDITVGNNKAIGILATGTSQTINLNGNVKIGNDSFGLVNQGTGNTVTSSASDTTLGTDAVFIYQNDTSGTVTNNTKLVSTGDKNYGLYGNGTLINKATIDFKSGNGNIGMYSTGGVAINDGGVINVSQTNLTNKEYGVGMATGYYDNDPTSPTYQQISNQGRIENRGTINVDTPNSMGMYAVGPSSTAINYGNINLTAANTTGMYLDRGAKGENWGNITSTAGLAGVKGIYLSKGSYIKNYGNITINSDDSKSADIWTDSESKANVVEKATGTNPLTGTVQTGNDAGVKEVTPDGEKQVGGIKIMVPPVLSSGVSIVDVKTGIAVTPYNIDTDVALPTATTVNVSDLLGTRIGSINIPSIFDNTNYISSSEAGTLGMYVDTSGINYTNPIKGLSNLSGLTDINLYFGTEATDYTTAKAIQIGDNILTPYNDALTSVVTAGSALNVTSASMTWMAQPVKGSTKPLETVYLVKIPYQAFAAAGDSDTYNFLAGLEQRYGTEGLGSREHEIFKKLNGLGNGEGHILAQAIDEMKGHQYANIQQRIYGTGRMIDKEISHLTDDWRNTTRQSNKIKAFGMRDEYSTDTAGIIDYKSDAYGFVYVHEDEALKLGNSTGWYVGAAHNRIDFDDIGKSKENMTMLKAGLFKSTAFDDNGSLQWTIAGDIFGGINNIERRFWIVDEVFHAESDYYSYGASVKNELGYSIRTSERTSIRPYASLDIEYGRFSDIKEEKGEMRLEVKGNDYISVKPEVGVEFKYRQPIAVKTNLSIGVSAAYGNELGKLNKVNQARVGYTTADWYNLRNEKEDRKGSAKFDLNIGLDNTRFGVTLNAGYDTKGENIRGGIGFRAIY